MVQEASPGQGGQAAGLDHRQEHLVLVDDRHPGVHLRLLPGGTVPDQFLPRRQQGVRLRAPAVQLHLAPLDAGAPDGLIPMGVMAGEMGQHGQPRSLDLFPIGKAPVEAHDPLRVAVTS